eukprot:4277089-Pyramimonas_sp.AAC.1
MDVGSEDSCTGFPHENDLQFLESMDDETFPHGPASTNMFRRSSLPPAPDKTGAAEVHGALAMGTEK